VEGVANAGIALGRREKRKVMLGKKRAVKWQGAIGQKRNNAVRTVHAGEKGGWGGDPALSTTVFEQEIKVHDGGGLRHHPQTPP